MKRGTEDEMVGWHHQLNGFEFEETPGDGEGQVSLACYSPWGHKDSDMIEQPNKNRASFLSPNSLKMLSVSCLLEDFCCDASRHPWVTGWRKRRVLSYTSIV